jgi:hypothetical protein
MDRVKSGSYLMALSVLVFGITTFAGFGCSFGVAVAGFFSSGFVAVFAFSWLGAVVSGFFTGSALGASAFEGALDATVFAAALAGTAAFFGAAGAGFFTVFWVQPWLLRLFLQPAWKPLVPQAWLSKGQQPLWPWPVPSLPARLLPVPI